MRVLFAVYPNSLAHLYPVVPLAWAFASAGHDVRVASHVSAAEQIASTGLTPVLVGDGPGVRLTADCDTPKTPEEVDWYSWALGLTPAEREEWIVFYQYLMLPISDYIRVDRPEAAELVQFARAWRPDLVLWEPVFPCGAIAARACGAAHARLMYGRDIFAWCLERLEQRASQLGLAGLDPNPLASKIRPLAERYGIEVDNNLLVADWTVDAMPEGLRLPTRTTTVRVRHVPYAGAQAVPAWLYEPPPRPRVALSLGESTRRFVRGDWDRTPKIMKALDGLDLDVVATLNSRQLEDVPQIPDNVRTMEWVNLNQLLPTCCALIHHGGTGTFSAAVAAKVPQLVCDIESESLLMRLVTDDPQAARSSTYQVAREFGVNEGGTAPVERAHWELPAKKVEATPVAQFVTAAGSGARLDHRVQTVAQMRELIVAVATSPSYREGAQAVYDQWLATPSASDVIPVLERLTTAHRRR